MLESSQLQGRDPSLQDSASDGGAGGAGRRGMELKEGMEERFILFVRAAQQVKHHLLKKTHMLCGYHVFQMTGGWSRVWLKGKH